MDRSLRDFVGKCTFRRNDTQVVPYGPGRPGDKKTLENAHFERSRSRKFQGHERCGGNIGRTVVFITTGRPILRSADANPFAERSWTVPYAISLENARFGGTTHASGTRTVPYEKSLIKSRNRQPRLSAAKILLSPPRCPGPPFAG